MYVKIRRRLGGFGSSAILDLKLAVDPAILLYMDPTTFAMQTAPYMLVASACPARHLHILGGIVSEVPIQPGEQNAWLNTETGEVFRMQSNLEFSLN